MSRKILCAAMLVAVIVAAWLVSGGGRGRPAGPRGGPGDEATGSGGATSPTLAVPSAPERGKEAPASPKPPTFGREGRPLGTVHGFVEGDEGRVAGARVTIRATVGATPDGMPSSFSDETVLDGTTDARGRFAFEGIPAGAYEVRAFDAAREGRAVAASSADAVWVPVRLKSAAPGGVVVEVRALDPSKKPVAGASVEWAGDIDAPARSAETDARGIAVFDRLEPVGWVTVRAGRLAARKAVRAETDGRPAYRKRVDLVLGERGSLDARVRVPAGESPAGTVVEAWAFTGWATGVLGGRQTADDDGLARFPDLPASSYLVLARSPRGLRQDLARYPPRSPGDVEDWTPLSVEVASGRMAVVDVVLVRGGTIRGRVVRDADGAPIAGARVAIQLPQGNWDAQERSTLAGVHTWRFDSPSPSERHHPLTFRLATTDADGRYEVDGLLPGAWRIVASSGGAWSFDRKDPVEVRDGATTEVLHRVRPAGTLELVAGADSYVGLRPSGREAVEVVFTRPWRDVAAVSIPGLGAGRWDLLALHSDPSHVPVPLASFDIRAGETTFFDLNRPEREQTHVRLFAAGRPAAEALVNHSFPSLVAADAEGRCAWPWYAFPVSEPVPILVRFDDASPWLSTRIPGSGHEIALTAPPGSLTVRAVGRDGRPEQGAQATLVPFAAKRSMLRPKTEIGAWRVDEWRTGSRAADASGVVRWSCVPEGPYDVRVRFAGTRVLVSAPVEVGTGPAEATIEEPPSRAILVRVLDPTGVPVAHARVSATVEDPQREVESGMSQPVKRHPWIALTEDLETGFDGTVEVPGVPFGRASVGAKVMDESGYGVRFAAGTAVEIGPLGPAEVVLRLTPRK